MRFHAINVIAVTNGANSAPIFYSLVIYTVFVNSILFFEDK